MIDDLGNTHKRSQQSGNELSATPFYTPVLRTCISRKRGSGLGDNGRKDDDPLSSYWRFRSWLPDDRHERGNEPKPRPAPAAERALKNVEHEFRNFSLDEFGEVFSKLLDEIREKWTRKDDDGAWPTQRRLWEAYESVVPTGDDEEIGNRLGKVLAYLKKHYRSRLLDHQKRRKRIDWGFTTLYEGDGDDKEPDKPDPIEQIPHGGADPADSVASAAHFETFREFVRLHYKGTRINELIAVIDAIENGAWKRRDVAAEAGVDEKRLAAILRTLRDLGKKWREQNGDDTPITEPLDQLDDEDTEPPTDDEDPE